MYSRAVGVAVVASLFVTAPATAGSSGTLLTLGTHSPARYFAKAGAERGPM
jgi:hypothetical protein